MATATDEKNPFVLLGGESAVRSLVERFYDEMEQHEPTLAALHTMEDGHVNRGTRDRFALFLMGWLGGPQDYTATHGHPRLRMRHGHVRVDTATRDAWLRSMQRALDAQGVTGVVRSFVDKRFVEVADFLRNTAG